MTEREYRTERGALLAALEHQCVRRGVWLIEGYRVEKLGAGTWRSPTRWIAFRRGHPVAYTADDFASVLRWIADHKG